LRATEAGPQYEDLWRVLQDSHKIHLKRIGEERARILQ
jgi:hypothetical protein